GSPGRFEFYQGLPVSCPSGPANSHLALTVATAHALRFIDRCRFTKVIEDMLGDRLVDAAHAIRGSIVNHEFVLELLKPEFCAHRITLRRFLQPDRERVVNLRLHFQKLARRLAHLKPFGKADQGIVKESLCDFLLTDALKGGGRQSLSFAVVVGLIEPVVAVDRNSGFLESFDDGVTSITLLNSVQHQLQWVSQHISSTSKL